MKRNLKLMVAALLALGTVGISTAHPTYAATDMVTNCAGSGSGSLPAVIAAAADGDTITFNQDCSGASAIALSTTGYRAIQISKDLSIDGTGHSITIDGGHATPLFDVEPGVNSPIVHFTDLTFSNGVCNGCDAGAIFASVSTVIITNSTFSGNSARENPVQYLGGNGGAIETSHGSLTVTGSTFSGNSADSNGGAIRANNTSLIITGSTFSGNSASGGGGAILNAGLAPTDTIVNSTFSGNYSYANGGAIQNSGDLVIADSTLVDNSISSDFAGLGNSNTIYNRGLIYIGGSIVASKSPGDCYNPTSSSLPVYDEGYNLEWTGSTSSSGYTCGFGGTFGSGLKVPGDIMGKDPQLGPLQDNGGPTDTTALPVGSPAIDGIPIGTSMTDGTATYTLCQASGGTDQRGFPRPGTTASCDYGAFEYQDAVAQSISFTGPSQTEYTYGDVPFRMSAIGGGSGSPITFTIATASQAVCSAGGANGATIAILAAGTCTVLANQAGSTGYSAAPQTSEDFTIDKKTLTVFASHDAITYGDAAPATFTNGYSGWVGTDSATTGAIAGRPNCGVPSYAAGDAPGSYDITCTAGNLAADNYTFIAGTGTPLPADGSTAIALGSLTVGKQTTSIDAISGSGTYGGTAILVATLKDAAGQGLGGKSVSFSINGTPVCGGSTGPTCPTTADGTNGTVAGQATLAGVSLSGIGAGSHSGWVSASFGNDTKYADSTASGDVSIGKASATLGLSNPSQTYDGTAKSVIVTTAPSGLSGVSVTYTGSGATAYGPSTSAPTNAGSYSVDASLTNDNYTAKDVTGMLTITPASQSISFTLPAGFSKTYGDVGFSVASYASATSGLAVGISSATTSVCTVSGGTVTILAAGSCTLNGSQPGNGNYNAALNVSQTFSIAKAATTVAVTPSANPSILKQGVTFTVMVTSVGGIPGGTVTITDGTTALASGVTLSPTGSATLTTSALTSGTHNIAASYSGSANFTSSATSSSLGQQVRYNVKVLSTSSLTIVLQLLDYNNTNVSASKLTVTAECVVPYSQPPATTCGSTPTQTISKASGYTNNYKGMGPAYSYSVSSHGLTKGQQYDLVVQTDGDPIWHAVPFTA